MSTTSSPITLIIGLGNPGPEYAQTRHNAGARFVEKLAADFNIALRHETKFKGSYSIITDNNYRCYLFIPSTFMNHSGQAVKAITDFYKIEPNQILVAHDELDLPTGDIRLKFRGGHGGHNGLRDIINHLHTPDFYRLRIGIGHPGIGQKNLVVDYVLSRPSRSEQEVINQNLDNAQSILPYLFRGEIEKAMQELHTAK